MPIALQLIFVESFGCERDSYCMAVSMLLYVPLFIFVFLDGVVVGHPPFEREVTGLTPGLVIPYTLNLVVVATLLSAQGGGVSITTDWLV